MPVSLSDAQRVMDAAIGKAEEIGVRVCVALVARAASWHPARSRG